MQRVGEMSGIMFDSILTPTEWTTQYTGLQNEPRFHWVGSMLLAPKATLHNCKLVQLHTVIATGPWMHHMPLQIWNTKSKGWLISLWQTWPNPFFFLLLWNPAKIQQPTPPRLVAHSAHSPKEVILLVGAHNMLQPLLVEQNLKCPVSLQHFILTPI